VNRYLQNKIKDASPEEKGETTKRELAAVAGEGERASGLESG
jgi:hypothetical protein